MRTCTALVLALTITPALAQTTPDFAPVVAAISSVAGHEVTIPPARPNSDCRMLDGTRFRRTAGGRPDPAMDILRLRQTETDVELDFQGLRAAPHPSDHDMDDRLRSMLRLPTADLGFQASHDQASGSLTIPRLRLTHCGGTVVELSADLHDADLSAPGLAAGRVTRATLVWRSDGKLIRTLMDMTGEGLAGTPGGRAADASRAALAEIVDLLPPARVDDSARKALAAAVRSLPQGRGKLEPTLVSEDGIGAARPGRAALSVDPLSPEALETPFDGVTVTAACTPALPSRPLLNPRPIRAR